MADTWSLAQRLAAASAVAFSAFAALAPTAQAQFSGNYVDTNVGPITSAANPCNNAFTRTINVPDSVTITDVDFGLIIDHNNRGDTAAALRHPDGTQVLLFFASGGALNDYNVRFDQAAGGGVDTAPQNVNNNTGAAPYQFDVQPRTGGTMNIFNGKDAQGDWLFLTCDNTNNGVDGQYLRSELFITGTQNFADLRLDVSASTLTPTYGSNVTITLDVTHEAGSLATSGVTVDYQVPSGMTFVSASGDGTYNDATGTWTIGAIAAGGSASIDIVAEVLSTGSHANIAEISASATTDPDSTPGNRATDPAEDDTDSVTLLPGSSGGTGPSGEPSLSCAAPEVFDWDTNTWVYGAAILSRSYPTGGSDNTSFDFAFTGNTNRRGTGGNASPETNQEMTGGILPVEDSLYYWQNLQSAAESVDLTIDVGVTGIGVQDLQFTVFDVDFTSGQFRDQISVTGSLNGSPVFPVLTPGSANSAIGSTGFGTTSSGNTEAGGNIIVTFLSPVDTVTINYGNTEASAGVSNQAMAVHDIDYCPRQTDFGDAPISYGTPSHLVASGYLIGATAPDGEASTQVSVAADGDDVAGSDDEDAIDFSGLIAGVSSTVDVDVIGSGGFLQMWIDWNDDGDFDDTVDGINERVATDVTIVGTSGTATIPVTVPASAALTPTVARVRWSTTSGLGVSGGAPDGEVEDHALTLSGAASLNGSKTNAIYDPFAAGLYATPGNDVIYTITVSNSGAGPADTDSVVLIDKLPDEVTIYNGDIDFGGPDTFPGTDPVGFTQSAGAGLTFTYGTDVRFATGTTPPANFAACSVIAPDNTYRDDLTYICFNPKGSLAAGDPDPEFSVSFRARIE